MKNEGMMLVAFIILAVTLLILVVRSEKEHLRMPVNPLLANLQVQDDLANLDNRVQEIENKISKEEKESIETKKNVDKAAVDLTIATAR